jgi:FixJ family two-component response regulator
MELRGEATEAYADCTAYRYAGHGSKSSVESTYAGAAAFIMEIMRYSKLQHNLYNIIIEGDTQEADLCHCQQTSRLLKTLTTREVYLLITVQNAFIPQRSKICLLQFNFLLR